MEGKLTHETTPQREVVLVAKSLDARQSVEDLLKNSEAILQVGVLLQPLTQRFTCTNNTHSAALESQHNSLKIILEKKLPQWDSNQIASREKYTVK